MNQKPAIALISYPTWRFFDPEETYPIGLLTLASALRQADWPFEFVHLDSQVAEEATFSSLNKGRMLRRLASDLAHMDVGIYGFSTINVSYPFTLLLAAEIKRLKPKAIVLFGGPQATATADDTMRAFPVVDFILKNEADNSLVTLLDAIHREEGYESVPGLVYRSGNDLAFGTGQVFAAEMDLVATPAYDLVDIPEHVTAIKLEAGRGCPFGCRFCTTNDLFSRRYRVKSPEKLVSDMQALIECFGKKRFILVHDLLVVNRKWTAAFCEALRQNDALKGAQWSCSARLDLVTEELLSAMESAGCEAIYYGIETGSQRLQKTIKKNFKVDRIQPGLRLTSEVGIDATASFIIGFPEETEDDIRETLDRLVEAERLPGVMTQLHVLSIYAGTPYWHDYKEQLRFDPDSHPDAGLYPELINEEIELIREVPAVFANFYAHADTQHAKRVKRIQLTASFALMVDPLLCVLLKEIEGSFLDVLYEWEQELERLPLYASAESLMPTEAEPYQVLVERYLEFVGNRWPDPKVATLVAFRKVQLTAMKSATSAQVKKTKLAETLPQVELLKSPHSPYELRESLRAGAGEATSKPCHLLFKKTGPDEIRVFELDELAWQLLRHCDGTKQVQDLACLVGQDLSASIPTSLVEQGLHSLRDQGFLTLSNEVKHERQLNPRYA